MYPHYPLPLQSTSMMAQQHRINHHHQQQQHPAATPSSMAATMVVGRRHSYAGCGSSTPSVHNMYELHGDDYPSSFRSDYAVGLPQAVDPMFGSAATPEENGAMRDVSTSSMSCKCSKGSKVSKGNKGKDNSSGTESGIPKPKRPLSAYNYFFHSERKRIAESYKQQQQLSSSLSNEGKASDEKKPKKIGFSALAKLVASRWKELDESKKELFNKLALVDKKRYDQEMTEWKRMKAAAEAGSLMPMAAQAAQYFSARRHSLSNTGGGCGNGNASAEFGCAGGPSSYRQEYSPTTIVTSFPPGFDAPSFPHHRYDAPSSMLPPPMFSRAITADYQGIGTPLRPPLPFPDPNVNVGFDENGVREEECFAPLPSTVKVISRRVSLEDPEPSFEAGLEPVPSRSKAPSKSVYKNNFFEERIALDDILGNSTPCLSFTPVEDDELHAEPEHHMYHDVSDLSDVLLDSDAIDMICNTFCH